MSLKYLDLNSKQATISECCLLVCSALSKALHVVAQRVLGATVTLTNTNVQQFHDMVMRKEPHDRHKYLASIQTLDVQSIFMPQGSPFEEFDPETTLLLHLPNMRLHSLRVQAKFLFSQRCGRKYTLGLQASIGHLRSLDIATSCSSTWTPLLYSCADNLESLALNELQTEGMEQQIPTFVALKTLIYKSSWPACPIQSSSPILALIAKSPKLEALETPFLYASELNLLLRGYGAKIRRLVAPSYTLRETLKNQSSMAILANLTYLKYRYYGDAADDAIFKDIPCMGSVFPRIHTLQFNTLDSQGLKALTKSLADHNYLSHLRHLKIEEVSLGKLHTRVARDTAVKILGDLWSTCLERSIHLTTVDVDSWPKWSGCGMMAGTLASVKDDP